MEPKDFRRELRRNQTNAEKILWLALRAGRLKGIKFRRQHSIGKFVVDFYCPRYLLIIEVDGSVHDNPGQAHYDFMRQQKLQNLGYTVLRFDNDNVQQNLENVLAEIEAHFVE